MNNLNGLRNNIFFTLFPGRKAAPEGAAEGAGRAFEDDSQTGFEQEEPAGHFPAAETAGPAITPYDSSMETGLPGGADETDNLSSYQIPDGGRFKNFGEGSAGGGGGREAPPANDGRAAGAGGAQPASDYEKALKKYEDAAAQQVEHQAGWKNAVFVGLQLANKVLNPQDQSPVKWLGQAKHDKRVTQAMRELAPLQALEDRQAALAAAGAQTEKNQAELAGLRERNRGLVISNAAEQSRRAYETLTQKDYITPEEAAEFSRAFGIRINPYDARQFYLTEKNGLSMATNARGIPQATVVDGSTMTGPVREALQSGEPGGREYGTAAMNYTKKVAEARAAAAEAQARIKDLEQRRLAARSNYAGGEPMEMTAIDGEIEAARARLAAAQQILQSPAPRFFENGAPGAGMPSNSGPAVPAVDRLKLFQ